MSETLDNLQQQIIVLLEENRHLKENCDRLEAIQSALERVIGDSNNKLLRAEMISLELEQVFSACTDALWVVREDGVVIRANEAMLQLLDKPAAEVIGKQCTMLLDYALCREAICPIKRVRSKTRREYDIQLPHLGKGSGYFILTTAPLVTLDGTPGIIGQFKDITGRKTAEQELAAANKTLERMAKIDGLTQIANRRCFDETLEKEWRRLGRNRKPLSLLLGDIDFFKKYNDRYGHQAGDSCLQRVSQALAGAVLRPADLVARYGGEEFAILLPEVDLQGALQVGERILTSVRGLAIEHQDSTVSEIVTMSLGAATLIPEPAQCCGQLIKLADEALYQSKNGGRNRILPDGQNKLEISKNKSAFA